MTMPPEPCANPALAGHDAAAAEFAAAARRGRLHHAWLLAGPIGIGKATFAYRAARWLLAGLPPNVAGQAPMAVPEAHAVFRQVAAAAHPDLKTLEPNTGDRGKKAVLRATDARNAIRFLAHTPAAGGWRVVVLDGAERVDNAAVPNILLKTLEEPPPRTVLLVVTAQPDRLLPTIRSRCRRLDLAPLSGQVLDGLLAGWRPELAAADRARITALADGAPGRALRLAAGEGMAVAALATRLLSPRRADRPRAAAVAEQVADRRDPAALVVYFALLRRGIAADLAAAARGGVGMPDWLGARTLAEGANLWSQLGRLAIDTERLNLDPRQAVLTSLHWLDGAAPDWD